VTAFARRDYSLTGTESARAVERGLADAKWFQAEIDPGKLRELTARQNMRPAIDLAIWVALIVGFGALAWSQRGSWWAVPAFFVYGSLVGGSSDARWHECGHGTAFRSQWLNDVVYYPASFMLAREATYWRWSHFRHHTDTIIVGRDAEIVFPRPPSIRGLAWAFAHIQGGSSMMLTTLRHALGRPDVNIDVLVPEPERSRVYWEARLYVVIWFATIVWAVTTRSFYPLLLIGGPTIYGAWLVLFFGVTQHGGLKEDELDHRRSTRTVLVNPIFGFLYLNMNYHIEHHMYPAVPYYNLPKLHDEVRDQLPTPMPNMIATYREIIHAFSQQSKDPTWEIPRQIPDVPGRRGSIVQGFEWVGEEASDGWVDIGPADLSPGEMRAVEIDGSQRLLACTEEGDLALVDRTCTHGEADLSTGAILGCEIECPKHNGRFDLRTGLGTRRPIQTALGTYEIRVSAGRVESAGTESAGS
jgi:Na+-transporting NADH:ubiquinone oxidoreductase subunit F